jgi:hypothetical protein
MNINDKVDVKFRRNTGMCEDPGIYIKYEHLAMAKPQMPAFGQIISIEVAMELMVALQEAMEAYERWEDAETNE